MSPVDAFGRPQTVLLLGGSSDIGLAIVNRMVDSGTHTIVLAGRDTESLPPTTRARTERRYFDAADTDSHAKFFDEVFEDHPNIDVVIYACGVLHTQGDVDETPDLAVEMAQVNYLGAASSLLHANKHLEERGSGHIIVLSSVAGVLPRRSNFAYGSSKAGIDFLARGMTPTASDSDVHVMVVRPGFVHTSMTAGMKPRPLAVSADTVGKAVMDGLAHQDQVVWVPRVLKWVMGILRFLPRRLVERLDR